MIGADRVENSLLVNTRKKIMKSSDTEHKTGMFSCCMLLSYEAALCHELL